MVRHCRADATRRAAMWESRTPPEFILSQPRFLFEAGFFIIIDGERRIPAGRKLFVGLPSFPGLNGRVQWFHT